MAGKFQSNMAARKDRKRYHFLLSSFDSEEKAKLSLSIQELGGTYFETPVSYASSSKINVRGLYFVVYNPMRCECVFASKLSYARVDLLLS